jgi:hypothetical protein
MKQKTEFQIHAMRHGKLAAAYGVSLKTFRKLLKPFQAEIGERLGHTYYPKQVAVIVKNLGWPKGGM